MNQYIAEKNILKIYDNKFFIIPFILILLFPISLILGSTFVEIICSTLALLGLFIFFKEFK